jgi:metallo-beta-lactamase family protein
MFQGSERLQRKNKLPSEVLAGPLDAVLLTHGHLDHCGRLPLLVKAGYTGPIYATEGTIDIADLILRDAARIAEDDAERENAKRKKKRVKLIKPLFRSHDVTGVSALFETVEYNHRINIAPGITARFVEAGHILGSACIEVQVKSKDESKSQTIVFSGDVGHWHDPIVREPARIEHADLIFMESTYGDRKRESLEKTLATFEQILKKTIDRDGKILIPTFAVGRAQEILYHLAALIRNKRIPSVPIFLDSPMAIDATRLYARHWQALSSKYGTLMQSGQLDSDLSSLITCQTAEESRALNSLQGPCIILAGAGMCDAGRILHHMRHCLNEETTTLIVVGYQAKGSLGRELIEGAGEIKILGETVHIRATISNLEGFSAHADQSDLLRWLEPMVAFKPAIVLTHGEPHSIDQLAYEIKEKFDIVAIKPKYSETVELDAIDLS